jgi:hypothetical protein
VEHTLGQKGKDHFLIFQPLHSLSVEAMQKLELVE